MTLTRRELLGVAACAIAGALLGRACPAPRGRSPYLLRMSGWLSPDFELSDLQHHADQIAEEYDRCVVLVTFATLSDLQRYHRLSSPRHPSLTRGSVVEVPADVDSTLRPGTVEYSF